MNSYLLISGAIQPDTTRTRSRGRLWLTLIVTLLFVAGLTAAVVRARANPEQRAHSASSQLGRS